MTFMVPTHTLNTLKNTSKTHLKLPSLSLLALHISPGHVMFKWVKKLEASVVACASGESGAGEKYV